MESEVGNMEGRPLLGALFFAVLHIKETQGRECKGEDNRIAKKSGEAMGVPFYRRGRGR